MKTKYFEEMKAKLVYVFRINDAAHANCLKVGDTTIDVDPDEEDITAIAPNSSILNRSAKARINQQTQTAGIAYELLYTETASYRKGSRIIGFNDKEVHSVLERSGIKKKIFPGVDKQGVEWFITDLETIKKAIAAVKEGRESLTPDEVTQGQSPIEFRPEQQEAINKTVKRFGKANKMLWNAKMRFGKTLSALKVAREMGFRRTLILTHRPVVDASWFEDFNKIFYDRPNYAYGSKNVGSTHANLERRYANDGISYVYFASMQDLRGSEKVGGKFDKNDDIFKTLWDFIIIDEAHEGTQTSLGKAVITELTKSTTKVLQLSGTPFNLMDEMAEDEIFTWDYTMEQRAKLEWDRNHFGDPNPYAGLPRMNIYTYDLGRLLHNDEFNDEEIAFNFREFFRTTENGSFVHETDVTRFLNLLTKEDPESMYPFANQKYRNIFRHTLWMLPGVKEAKAFSALLRNHPVFGNFEIVNVAGDGDEEEAHEEALKKVQNAIKDYPNGTITLSCGRLTTGVSVPQWMGVMMLSGSYSTSAASYMQTIFRVQTPYTRDGLVKEDCYVFDFAPDRTLQVLATVPRVSTKAGKTTEAQKRALGDFLNFCPVIGMEGSTMKPYDANKMMEQLKKVYVERVVRNGFEDSYLYSDELLKLDGAALEEFQKLKKAIGTTKAMEKSGDIDVNAQGLTDEQYAEKEQIEKKPKKERTPEEEARLAELREKKKNRDSAISILRGISIRMPLLIYGADIKDEDEELTIDNFTNLVDNASWDEFMPTCTFEETDVNGKTIKSTRPLDKGTFNKFKKYYDPDIFTAAGKRIRAMARAADRLTIEERIERIAGIFNTFRNPDKETVLTPWRVVNMHMGDTLGGYNFFNEDYSKPIAEPRYIDHHRVTDEVFAPGSHLLEINSKSGLYPLYLAYNLYRRALKEEIKSPQTIEQHQAIWDRVVRESVFVICKTPMAKAITRRTLLGFREGTVNMWAPDDLINKIKNQPELFIKKVHDLIGKDVKINAIVGNPPYQIMDGGAGASAKPVYNEFVDIAKKISPTYISMIFPARWYAGGKGLDEFRERTLNDTSIKSLYDFADSKDVFPTVSIAGGICYILRDLSYDGQCTVVNVNDGKRSSSKRYLNEYDVLVRNNSAIEIINKIKYISQTYLDNYVFSRNTFGLPSNIDGRIDTNDNGIKTLTSRGIIHISEKEIINGKKYIDKYKVIITYAMSGGNKPSSSGDYQIISSLQILSPNEICSETFLILSVFDNFSDAENMKKYIATKFSRFLILQSLSSIHITKSSFRFVPLQDFTEKSDIDWTQSVADIDRQLYAKYGLTHEEIAFIESMIKPMV